MAEATESSILFDYQQAIAQAYALEELADSVQRTSNGKIEDGLQAAACSWNGDNATRFRDKGTQLQGQLCETARALRNAADEVRKIASRVRQVEMANLALIQEREYQS